MRGVGKGAGLGKPLGDEPLLPFVAAPPDKQVVRAIRFVEASPTRPQQLVYPLLRNPFPNKAEGWRGRHGVVY